MLSGIGDEAELRRLSIPVVHHIPGVGHNFQDHFGIGCVWEYQQPLAPRGAGGNHLVNSHQIQSTQWRLSVLIRRSARNFRVARDSLRIAGHKLILL
jgi:choline dehydrogenase-like flavoprotein